MEVGVVKLLVKPAADDTDDDDDAGADDTDDADDADADDSDADDDDLLKGGQGLSWHELTDDQRVACPTQPPPFVSTDGEEHEDGDGDEGEEDVDDELADFLAVFFHISNFDICHEIQIIRHIYEQCFSIQ